MSQFLDNKELYALVELIDEPDEKYFRQVSDKIISFGYEANAYLDAASDKYLSNLSQYRIKNLKRVILFNWVKEELRLWANTYHSSLLNAYFLVSKCFAPNFDELQLTKMVHKLRNEIWLEMSPKHTAMEKIGIMNRIIFDRFDLKENPSGQVNKTNTFIYDLLESKNGNLFSIQVFYLMLAEMLEFNLSFVYLPRNSMFLLSYSPADIESISKVPTYKDLLFFINCKNRGELVSKLQVETLLSHYHDNEVKIGNNVMSLQVLLYAYYIHNQNTMDKETACEMLSIIDILGDRPIGMIAEMQ